ncbi:unnamed protein product [Ceratitis capitata]|uniref:(Mediterranean fruit fly) hypothetical protein n=1 Tax=Ceratitis capitata TaxID=7213 RepID=A0A811V5B2_CERCA|nr:unnamed protein product [Ceratitis capitata]
MKIYIKKTKPHPSPAHYEKLSKITKYKIIWIAQHQMRKQRAALDICSVLMSSPFFVRPFFDYTIPYTARQTNKENASRLIDSLSAMKTQKKMLVKNLKKKVISVL